MHRDKAFAAAGFLAKWGVHLKVRVFYHDKCFDGDENAIVDFKYSSSPKITWWFDHHESAFLSPADAEHFEQDQSNRKFYDPDFKSCTSFIAMIAQQRFGFDPSPMADLVHWADIIDGALYPDAKTAVAMEAPAMKLTMVIESAPDHGFVPNLIPLLATKSLAEILEERFVAPLLPPLLKRHELSIGILEQRTECKDATIFFDVTDHDLEGYNKFIPYLLHPESVYSVSVSASPVRAKISLGTNPWNQAHADANLASLAEQYGGGGHQRVSAISFDPSDLPRAREVAATLTAQLRKK